MNVATFLAATCPTGQAGNSCALGSQQQEWTDPVNQVQERIVKRLYSKKTGVGGFTAEPISDQDRCARKPSPGMGRIHARVEY
jgi:hypothetical protein